MAAGAESATVNIINTSTAAMSVHERGAAAGKTAEEMKDVFIAMKGRPQPRAVFRPEKDITEKRFFKETDPTNLMQQVRELEQEDKDAFYKFMIAGKTMIEAANEGELQKFEKAFYTCEHRNLAYWHVQQAFKAAVKHRHLFIIEHIVEDMGLCIKHEAFFGFFHTFIFLCTLAETAEDEVDIEVNRQIVRYLCKATGKEGIDEMDKLNSSTVLHKACEMLTDMQIVEAIVSQGADVNAVNNDNELPLTLIKMRREKDPENEVLEDIEWFLEKRGAVDDWHNIPRE